MLSIVVASAFLMAAAILVWVFTKKTEGFSDYNAPNEFMKMYYKDIAENQDLIKKFPYFGTGNKAGLRCRKPGNEGCDTIWLSGELVERTPEINEQLKCRFGIK